MRWDGPEETVRNWQTMVQTAAGRLRIDQAPIAVRGENLALLRWLVVRVGFESESVFVVATDADGRWTKWAIFDPNGLDTAMDTLDDWYLEGEAAPYADVFRVYRDVAAAHWARDWDRVRALHADDMRLVDHSPLALTHMEGADALVEALKEGVAIAPTMRIGWKTVHALGPAAACIEVEARGATPDGAVVEIVFHAAMPVRDGRIASIDRYPEDRLADALARFEELCAEPVSIRNAFVAASEAVARASEAGRWDQVADLFTPDAVLDDHRPIVGTPWRGRDEFVANLRAAAEVAGGDLRIDVEPIAVRGGHVGVTGWWVRRSGFDSHMLIVGEVAPDGRVPSASVYDPQDLDLALADLDNRYARKASAGEGSAGG